MDNLNVSHRKYALLYNFNYAREREALPLSLSLSLSLSHIVNIIICNRKSHIYVCLTLSLLIFEKKSRTQISCGRALSKIIIVAFVVHLNFKIRSIRTMNQNKITFYKILSEHSVSEVMQELYPSAIVPSKCNEYVFRLFSPSVVGNMIPSL